MKVIVRRTVSTAIALAAAGCGVLGPDSKRESGPPASISVVDEGGRPLAGATVRLYRLDGDEPASLDDVMVSGADGRVFLPTPLRAHRYLAAGSMAGRAGGMASVVVRYGVTVVGNLVLPSLLKVPGRMMGRIGPDGGLLTTRDGTYAVSIPSGALAGTVNVAVVPLLGVALPLSPVGKVAFVAGFLDLAGASVATPIRILLAAPFGLPEGTTVPIFRLDEATGTWIERGTGLVSGARITASATAPGTYAAFVDLALSRRIIKPDALVLERALGAKDSEAIAVPWTPVRPHPISYAIADLLPTGLWIGSVLEQIQGYPFDVPTALNVLHDRRAPEVLRVYRRTERTSLAATVGGVSYAFVADTETRWAAMVVGVIADAGPAECL